MADHDTSSFQPIPATPRHSSSQMQRAATLPSFPYKLTEQPILYTPTIVEPLPLKLFPQNTALSPYLKAADLKTTILVIAKDICAHERSAGIWKRNIEGNDKLYWFIQRFENATYYLTPSTPGSDSFRLHDITEFEYLFYMTCAKVRELFESLAIRFKSGFMDNDTVLHNVDIETGGFRPFTAKHMMDFLRKCWDALMEPKLVAALQNAMKVQQCLENVARKYHPEFVVEEIIPDIEAAMREEVAKDRDRVVEQVMRFPGLLEINAMSPAMIATWVNEKWRKTWMKEKEDRKSESQRKKKKKKTSKAPTRPELAQDVGENSLFDREIEERELQQAILDLQRENIDTSQPNWHYLLEHRCQCHHLCECREACTSNTGSACSCKVLKKRETGLGIFLGNSPSQGNPFCTPPTRASKLMAASEAFDQSPLFTGAVNPVSGKVEVMPEDEWLAKLAEFEAQSQLPTSATAGKDKYPLALYNSPALDNSKSDIEMTQPEAEDSRFDSLGTSFQSGVTAHHTSTVSHASSVDPLGQNFGQSGAPQKASTVGQTLSSVDHTSRTGFRRQPLRENLFAKPLPQLPQNDGMQRSRTAPVLQSRTEQSYPPMLIDDPIGMQVAQSRGPVSDEFKKESLNLFQQARGDLKTFKDRRFISAGGPGKIGERPTVSWNIAAPAVPGISVSAEDVKARLPKPMDGVVKVLAGPKSSLSSPGRPQQARTNSEKRKLSLSGIKKVLRGGKVDDLDGK